MTLPAGVTAATYNKALADVRGLRACGTYQAKPPKLPAVDRPDCGTRRGYGKHQRAGEESCYQCRGANAAADRRLKATGSSVEVSQ